VKPFDPVEVIFQFEIFEFPFATNTFEYSQHSSFDGSKSFHKPLDDNKSFKSSMQAFQRAITRVTTASEDESIRTVIVWC
jgi:hypothetical protein